MSDGPKALTLTPHEFKSFEETLAEPRIAKCNETLASLLGPNNNHPRIAMAFSGGGWRSMASGVALMDSLSIPLENPTNKTGSHQTATKIKLMDTISHAFGLSGGSWVLMTTLAGAAAAEGQPLAVGSDAHKNPFHYNPNRPETFVHPWLHGPKHSFNPRDYQYDGLVDMVSESNVNAALQRNGLRELLAKALPIDSAVAAAALMRGGTKVETWGHFLGSNLLSFLEDGNADNGSEKYQKRLSTVRSMIASGAFPFVVVSAAANRTTAAGGTFRSFSPANERAASPTSPSHYASPLVQEAIRDGDDNDRQFDWVEVSPFFVRNPTTLDCVWDTHDDSAEEKGGVDNCGVWFPKGYGPMDYNAIKADKLARHDLRMHQLMAFCGSAFAFDSTHLKGAIPIKFLDDAVQTVANFIKTDLLKIAENTPILKGTLTSLSFEGGGAVSYNTNGAPVAVNTLRDAGLDFNVPFPPMFEASSGRKFDIIIVMDAGAKASGALELKNAILNGYVKLKGEYSPLAHGTHEQTGDSNLVTTRVTDGMKYEKNKRGDTVLMPHETFPADCRLKIYETEDNTLIFYFLGLTERPTSTVILEAAEVHKDMEQVHRDATLLKQALLDTLFSRFGGAAKQPAVKRDDFSSPLGVGLASPSSPFGLSSGASGSNFASISAVNINSVSSPLMASSAFCVGECPSSGAFGSPASPTPASPAAFTNLISFSKGPRPFTTEASKVFIAAAALEGKLRTHIDAFFAADNVLNSFLPVYKTRIIEALEKEAVSMLSQQQSTGRFLDELKEISQQLFAESDKRSTTDPLELFHGLLDVGILQPKVEGIPHRSYITSLADVNDGKLRYSTEWVDFYAVTALTHQKVPKNLPLRGALLDLIERKEFASAKPKSLPKVDAMFIHDYVRSKFCLLLGSMVNKLGYPTPSPVTPRCNLIDTYSDMVVQQYLSQLSSFRIAAVGETTKESVVIGTGTASLPSAESISSLEMMVRHMATNICDFYCEMLCTDTQGGAEQEDASVCEWRAKVLASFLQTVGTITQAVQKEADDSGDLPAHHRVAPSLERLGKEKYKPGILSASMHILLLAEAIAKSSDPRSVWLLDLLLTADVSKLTESHKQKKPQPVTGLGSSGGGSKVDDSSSLANSPNAGPLLRVIAALYATSSGGGASATKAGQHMRRMLVGVDSEHFLRISASLYEPAVTPAMRGHCLEILRRGASAVDPSGELFTTLFAVDLQSAANHSFPGAVRFFVNEALVGMLAKDLGSGTTTISFDKRRVDFTNQLLTSICNATPREPLPLFGAAAPPLLLQPFRSLNDGEFLCLSLFSAYDVMSRCWQWAKIPTGGSASAATPLSTFDDFFKVTSDTLQQNFDFVRTLADAGCDDQNVSILTVHPAATDTNAVGDILASVYRYRRFMRVSVPPTVFVTPQQRELISNINDKATLRRNNVLAVDNKKTSTTSCCVIS